MKLAISPALFDKAGITVAELSRRLQINYQTGMALAGRPRKKPKLFAPRALQILADYLEALGYTPEMLATVRISEIFSIK